MRGDETTGGVDLYAVVAEKVPTFAGMYVDEDTRTLYVLLTDQGQSLAAAARALQTVVRSSVLCEFTPVAVPARFSYLQLKAWDDRFIQVLSIPGTVSSGIDEAHNRLEVGVEDLAKQGPLVEAKLVELGVPREVVNIIQEEPISLLAEPDPVGLLPLRRTVILVSIAIGLLFVGIASVAFLRRRRKSRHHEHAVE